MATTRYTKDHEWIRLDGDVATVGITEHAQSQLGDIVYVELPEVGRKVEWRGKGVEETGVDKKSGKTVVRIDPSYFRPTEVDLLVGDASKARQKLGWKPKTSFAQLVKDMVASDLEDAKHEAANGKRSV